jgi:hypothetical protein
MCCGHRATPGSMLHTHALADLCATPGAVAPGCEHGCRPGLHRVCTVCAALQAGLYRQAAFCWEELLTMAPTNANILTRYADILYTLGGAANLRTARAYYSKAVQATAGRSSRALQGVLACCAALSVDKVKPYCQGDVGGVGGPQGGQWWLDGPATFCARLLPAAHANHMTHALVLPCGQVGDLQDCKLVPRGVGVVGGGGGGGRLRRAAQIWHGKSVQLPSRGASS